MAPTFAETSRGYKNLWGKAAIKKDKLGDAKALAKKILDLRARYEAIERKTDVPWFMPAVIHLRESSLNFKGVLHNGEQIIGTGKKTKLVPKGRGPFATWEEAAVDALTMPPHSLHKIKEWPIERILYELERFNGFGYTNKGINSPYLWSWSTLQQAGKYVADGKWDPKAIDKQPGCAAILKALALIDAGTAARLAGQAEQSPAALEDIPRAQWQATFTALKKLFG